MALLDVIDAGPSVLASVAQVFVHVAAPVSVVTSSSATGPLGTTVSSFCSVSDAPPLLLVCLHRQSRTGRSLMPGTAFGLNVLGAEQEQTAARFAAPIASADRFRGQPWVEVGGVPLLLDAVVAVRCVVEQTSVHGDHLVVLGRPSHLITAPGPPLVRHQQRYATVCAPEHHDGARVSPTSATGRSGRADRRPQGRSTNT